MLFSHSFPRLHEQQCGSSIKSYSSDGETIGAGIDRREPTPALGVLGHWTPSSIGICSQKWRERWVNLLDCGPRRAADDREKRAMLVGDDDAPRRRSQMVGDAVSFRGRTADLAAGNPVQIQVNLGEAPRKDDSSRDTNTDRGVTLLGQGRF